MRRTRRLVFLLCVGLLISGAGAVVVERSGGGSTGRDNPLQAVGATTTTTTTAPVTTTTTAPAPSTTTPAKRATSGLPGGPVRVPAARAPEPLVQLGTIEIPKIGLVHPVFEGITLNTIDRGPGHWPGTAMPGQPGNAVFAGHRVTHTHPFLNIDQLVAGDQVIFTINGVRSVYVMTSSEVVTPKNLSIVNQTPTPTATIFGCHPPHSAKFRYVVHLSMVMT
ncbi:MAG TPA: class E sortase [Acidimicrobiales bacterium]|nr:class E sortase [Acidimicrobiales bacterium]